MSRDDECEHGVSGFCHRCCAIHENKISREDDEKLDKKDKGPRYPGDDEPGYGDWDG